MGLKAPTARQGQSDKNGEGRLSKFYIHSGVRENSFCIEDPKHQMPELPRREVRERAGLRGAGYR